MHDLPRKKLAETIRKDRSLCHDHTSLQGILADHCRGAYKTERIVLVAAAQEGIPKDLSNTPTGVPKVLLISRLVVKLADNRGLSEDNARWAVESWALALETVTEKELEEISTPSGEPPGTPTGAHPLDPFSSPALSPEDQMRSAIVEALRDREVTDLEKMGLESLRLTMGVSRDAASRIFKEVADQIGVRPKGVSVKPGKTRFGLFFDARRKLFVEHDSEGRAIQSSGERLYMYDPTKNQTEQLTTASFGDMSQSLCGTYGAYGLPIAYHQSKPANIEPGTAIEDMLDFIEGPVLLDISNSQTTALLPFLGKEYGQYKRYQITGYYQNFIFNRASNRLFYISIDTEGRYRYRLEYGQLDAGTVGLVSAFDDFDYTHLYLCGTTADNQIIVGCQSEDMIVRGYLLSPQTLEIQDDNALFGPLRKASEDPNLVSTGMQCLSPDQSFAFLTRRSMGQPGGDKLIRMDIFTREFKDFTPPGIESTYISRASISPDGKTVAFAADYHDTVAGYDGQCEIYLMGTDGSDLRRVTFFQDEGFSEASSPLWCAL